MLKNLKLSRKMWGFTAFFLVMLLVVLGISMMSIKGILRVNGDVSELSANNLFMSQKETDHFKWVNAAKDLFVQNGAHLEVEKDHTKCSLGKFLYGEEGKKLAESNPEFAQLLEAIKEPHKHLHESATKIDDTWHQSHEGLSSLLYHRLDDHRKWTQTVAKIIIEKNPNLEVQLDPTQCAFGKFLNSDLFKQYAADSEEMRDAMAMVEEPHRKLHESAKKIKALVAAGEIEQANEVFDKATLENVAEIEKQFFRVIENEEQLLAAQAEAKEIFLSETIPALHDTQEAMKALSGSIHKHSDAAEKKMAETGAAAQWTTLAITVLVFVIGIVLSLIIVRSITGPVARIADIADSIALGDLNENIDIEQKDEIGQLADSFRKMKESLLDKAGTLEKIAQRDLTVDVKIASERDVLGLSMKKMVADLNDALEQVSMGVEQITIAGNQINTSAQNVAEGASEQASAVEEISSSLEEITSMSKQNADNASQAQMLAREANDSADKGNASMVRMEEAINGIKKSSDDTAKIVKTIDEIAFQTNLLALNAAVEAARAGEAGKGFAVVAGEVRKLAMRSAEAAKNTAAMIEHAVSSAENGVKINDEVAKALSEIAEKSNKVNNLVAEISAASNEQSLGISQVNGAISEMDKVTQRNAANSEESASAAEELNGQAGTLAAMVDKFTLLSRGSRISSEHSPQKTIHSEWAAVSVSNGRSNGSNGKNGKVSRMHFKEDLDDARNDKVRPEDLIPFEDDGKNDFSGF